LASRHAHVRAGAPLANASRLSAGLSTVGELAQRSTAVRAVRFRGRLIMFGQKFIMWLGFADLRRDVENPTALLTADNFLACLGSFHGRSRQLHVATGANAMLDGYDG